MPLSPEVADHLCLKIDPDLYWSDSSWFSWAIPEKGINGIFYNHFRPNMNCMLGGPAMWDGKQWHNWDMLYFDWQLMRKLPEGEYGVDYDKYDFVTPWSMSIELLEPLKKYRLGYDNNGFRLDLVWEAVAPPNVIGVQKEGGFDEAYKLHFEQPGRVTGSVELDGSRHDVDCYSIRDGSHGRRYLEKVPSGGYTWSTADDRHGWHFMGSNIEGTNESKAAGGYILRDGVMSSITRGVRRVLERNGPRPSLIEVELEDELGRALHATGREVSAAQLILFPDHGQWWTLYQWEYDGFTNAIGEDQEYYSLDDFRRWLRASPETWKTR